MSLGLGEEAPCTSGNAEGKRGHSIFFAKVRMSPFFVSAPAVRGFLSRSGEQANQREFLRLAMRQDLSAAFDRLKSLPFPEGGNGDDLDDWISDLAEVDGYVAGLAVSVLGGDTTQERPKKVLKSMRWRLEALEGVTEEDRTLKQTCSVYLSALEAVAELLHP